ncbi:MAG: nucleoside deaminase [Roseivirga sp.]|nr:nucleoside deaminase [Roseivirga sp.]
MNEHEKYMSQCLKLGRESMKLGNAPVGSVLVLNGKIIGEGLELGKTKNDITYHAEIEAIRDALKNLKTSKLTGAILYTTHEPCLMCSYAIRHYEIAEVHYGLATGEIGGHSSEHKILQTKQISRWSGPPVIQGGVLEQACQELHNEFVAAKEANQ